MICILFIKGIYFIKKVVEQLKVDHIRYYIKCIVRKRKLTLVPKVKYYIYKILKRTDKIEFFDVYYNLKYLDFIEYHSYTPGEFCKIMAESECLLDTDFEGQSGATPRLIWALALNKFIYTTNRNIVNSSFYNKEFIAIIDRDNPRIDFSLLPKHPINSRKSVECLRSDLWVRNFLF